MTPPWGAIRTDYEQGVSIEQLAENYKLPLAKIRTHARNAHWAIGKKTTEALAELPAVRAGAERVANTAHRAAEAFIRGALADHEDFRKKWRTLLDATDSGDGLNDVAQAMERMLSINATLLGLNNQKGDGGRGIVHIQLASANTGPVIEIPTTK